MNPAWQCLTYSSIPKQHGVHRPSSHGSWMLAAPIASPGEIWGFSSKR